METTQSTPTPESSPTGGSSLKNRRWLAVTAATLALAGAGFGIGVAQAQDSGNDATTTTEAPDASTPDASTPDGAAPDAADRPTDEEIQAFKDCMAANGVDLPDERPAPGDRPERTEEERAAFREALDACEDVKPEGFGRRGGPGCDGPGSAEGEGPAPDQGGADAPATQDNSES